MTVFIDISAALDKHLNDMSGVPAVAWENIDYKPVVGTIYLRPTNLQGLSDPSTLGSAGQDRTSGIYQVDVFSPGDEGKNESITMADTVANRFKRDTEIVYNGRTVRIVRASRGRKQDVDGWHMIPVSIEYYSLTNQR